MGSHPINLAVRFLLEIALLISMGYWGWKQSDSWFRFVLAFGIPIILAALWGIFAVPDDPSRSGAAPIVIAGTVRLILELGLFALSVWALNDLGYSKLSLTLGILVIIHYMASYDRITWLINQ